MADSRRAPLFFPFSVALSSTGYQIGSETNHKVNITCHWKELFIFPNETIVSPCGHPGLLVYQFAIAVIPARAFDSRAGALTLQKKKK